VDFQVECQANGEFTEPSSCSPVKCDDPPEMAHATVSPSEKIQFPMSIVYQCMQGYESDDGLTVLDMACQADALFDKLGPGMTQDDVSKYGSASPLGPCKPVKCGPAPQIANAKYKVVLGQTGEEVELKVDTFSDAGVGYAAVNYEHALQYTCDEGFSLNGMKTGATEFTVECGADKMFVNHENTCDTIEYTVTGVVSNAAARKMGGEPVAGAIVRVGGKQTTTGPAGKFSLLLAEGTYTIESEAVGFITADKPLEVKDDIATNVAMSATLPPNSWRAVVKWTSDADLDASVFFGVADGCKASFTNPDVPNCPDTGIPAMAAVHENDAAKKGPETIRVDNVGECDALYGGCAVTFYVKDFSGEALDDSGVTVAVYHGDEKVTTFEYPGGGESEWAVFTLDAQKGAAKVLLTGKQTLCPYIESTGVSNWGAMLDMEGWAEVGEKDLVTGLYRAPADGLHNLDQAEFATIADTEKMMCMTANWETAFDDAGEVSCMEGYFVAGLYRVGSKGAGVLRDGGHTIEEGDPLEQLDRARCCKPKEAPAKWLDCEDETWAFTEEGWGKCTTGKFLAGFTRSGVNNLGGIVKAKCCKYETKQGCLRT